MQWVGNSVSGESTSRKMDDAGLDLGDLGIAYTY